MSMQPQDWPKPPAPSMGVEAILAWLHTIEFQFNERHAWPWHRWRDCRPDTRAALKNIAGPLLQGNPTLVAARTLRFPETAKPETADHTKDAQTPTNLTSPHIALEACMIAFAETRFGEVESLAAKLLAAMANEQSSAFPGNKPLRAMANSMLLEMWWFAVYRQGMPEYVKAPDQLLQRLETDTKIWIQKWPKGILENTRLRLSANHLAMGGDIDAALPVYQKTVTATGYKSPVMPQALSVFHPSETHHDSVDWYKQYSSVSHHMATGTQDQHAILVSCDQRYLQQYGALFAALIRQNQGADLLHFHLINCDESDTALLKRISQDTGLTINHSFEDNTLFASAPYRAADIASTSRYIYLPEYLNHYESVTISDIDGWPNIPGSALRAFENNDLLISSWIWRKNTGFWRLPWSNVSAGLISVRASAGGKQFAEQVSRYIQHAIRVSEDRRASSYFADQAALFLTLWHMQAEGLVRFGFLGGGFQQSGDNSFYARHQAKRAAMEAKLKSP